MTNNKKIVSMRIDKDLWDLSKAILPCSRREFIEKTLYNYINSTNEIDALEKEIKEIKTELQLKESKLNELKKIREFNTLNKKNMDKAMETVLKIIITNKCITKEQIKYIANSNNILMSALEDNIKKKNYKIF